MKALLMILTIGLSSQVFAQSNIGCILNIENLKFQQENNIPTPTDLTIPQDPNSVPTADVVFGPAGPVFQEGQASLSYPAANGKPGLNIIAAVERKSDSQRIRSIKIAVDGKMLSFNSVGDVDEIESTIYPQDGRFMVTVYCAKDLN